MKVALITGILGQDGSYLAELLLKKGYKVIGQRKIILPVNPQIEEIAQENIVHLIENPDFILEHGDMVDSTSLWHVLEKYKPDEIYNLAAQSHVDISFKSSEPTTDINAMGTLRLLNAMMEVVPKCRFFQSSSCDIFGNNNGEIQNEESKFMPTTPYGCSKVFAHNIARVYRKFHKLHVSNGICFHHESSRRGENFVTKKIAKASAKIKLGLQDELYLGNLNIKRDWGYAEDFVEAIWLMLQQNDPDDYIIATGELHSLQEFLEVIFNYAGLDIKKHVKTDQSLMRDYEPPILIGDSTKIKTKLGWQPKTSFKELAKKMYEFELEKLKREKLTMIK